MTNYPTSIPSITRPSDSDSFTDGSATDGTVLIDAIADEIEAIATKVGVDSSAVATSIDYLLSNTSGGHDHDGTDSKTIPHSNLSGVTANLHHNQAHAISGADHTGALAFSQLPGAFMRVTSNATYNLTASLADVTGMSAALATNSTYTFDVMLKFSAGTTGDFKCAFTVPASSTLTWWYAGIDTSAAATTDNPDLGLVEASGTAATFGGVGAGTKVTARIHGIVRTSGTAGNLQLQAAQNTSNGTDTVLYLDSFGVVWQVA